MTTFKCHYCILLRLVCYCRPTDNAATSDSDKMSTSHSKIKCDRFAIQPGSTLTMARQHLLNFTRHFIYFLNPLKSNLQNDCSFGHGLGRSYDKPYRNVGS